METEARSEIEEIRLHYARLVDIQEMRVDEARRIADLLTHMCALLDEFVPLLRSRLEGPKWLRGKVSANGNRD